VKPIVRLLGILAGLWCFSLSQAQAQDRPGVELETVEESVIVTEVSLNGTVNALRTSRLSTAVAGPG
jgi:hypothetical protein